MKYLFILCVLLNYSISRAETCKFRALDASYELETKADQSNNCTLMDITVDGEKTSFPCKKVREDKMNAKEIQEDEDTSYLLRQAGIKPVDAKSLIAHSVRLDDDGGGIIFFIVTTSTGTIQKAGSLVFMGGTRSKMCEGM